MEGTGTAALPCGTVRRGAARIPGAFPPCGGLQKGGKPPRSFASLWAARQRIFRTEHGVELGLGARDGGVSRQGRVVPNGATLLLLEPWVE